jgi:hypothetical protein
LGHRAGGLRHPSGTPKGVFWKTFEGDLSMEYLPLVTNFQR